MLAHALGWHKPGKHLMVVSAPATSSCPPRIKTMCLPLYYLLNSSAFDWLVRLGTSMVPRVSMVLNFNIKQVIEKILIKLLLLLNVGWFFPVRSLYFHIRRRASGDWNDSDWMTEWLRLNEIQWYRNAIRKRYLIYATSIRIKTICGMIQSRREYTLRTKRSIVFVDWKFPLRYSNIHFALNFEGSS